MATQCFSWVDPSTWSSPSCDGGDTVAQAAIRAKGINPIPDASGNYSWLDPSYQQANIANGGTGDANVEAGAASSSATVYYNEQYQANTTALAAQNQKCGGFLADLLNPFSPNVDPNQWNCKAANALSGVNWTALIALGIVLAILATVHQVKEIV